MILLLPRLLSTTTNTVIAATFTLLVLELEEEHTIKCTTSVRFMPRNYSVRFGIKTTWLDLHPKTTRLALRHKTVGRVYATKLLG